MDLQWTYGPHLIRWRDGAFSCKDEGTQRLIREVLKGDLKAPQDEDVYAEFSTMRPGYKTAEAAAVTVYWATQGAALLQEAPPEFFHWYFEHSLPLQFHLTTLHDEA